MKEESKTKPNKRRKEMKEEQNKKILKK
jgi:hypothetical protein